MHIGKSKLYYLMMIEGEVTTKWLIWSDPSSNDPQPHHSINLSSSCYTNLTLNWKSSSISLLKFFLLKHSYLCSIYRWNEGSFAMNEFPIIINTCSHSCICQIDTWIWSLTHVNSSWRHWPSGDSETMKILLWMWPMHLWMLGSSLHSSLAWGYLHMQHTYPLYR